VTRSCVASIEALCAESPGLQFLAEQNDKLGSIARDGFRCGDRLREDAAHLDKVGRTHGIDRLADPAQGLIEATANLGAKAQRQRRAWLVRQFADAIEAENEKALQHFLRQSKGCDGQIENGGRACSLRDDGNGPRDITGKRMGGAPAVGERGAPGKAGRREPVDHGFDHGFFTAMQMVRASRIDHQPVRRVGRDHGCVQPKGPQRQPVEGFGIG
jgi:hypothetical protein